MIPCGLLQTPCKRENCVVMPGTVAQFCSDNTQAEVDAQYAEGVWEGTQLVGGTAATIAVGFIPVVGPVIQIASAANQGIQAYYTCSQLAEIRNNPSISQEVKDQFSRTCVTSSISAVTGLIGGSSSVVSQVAGTTLSATSQLTLTGLGMVDNFGNLTVSGINANNLCRVYGTSSYECYGALANAGIAIGSTASGVYQFGNTVNNYLDQQINQAFGDMSSWGYGYSSNSINNNLQEIGGGAYGDTYIDSNTGKLIKIYKDPSHPNNVLQMDLYKQFSDQAPFITHRGTLPDGSGFAQDYFSDTVPIKDFHGKLTMEEFNQAIEDLRTMQNVTGVPHGDLAAVNGMHGGNTLIQTLPDGSHKVVIVDYGGTQNHYKSLINYSPEAHMQSELKYFQQHLTLYRMSLKEQIINMGAGSSTIRDLFQSSSSDPWGTLMP